MTSAINSQEEISRLITSLEMTGDFRVLRRFVPRTRFAEYESDAARDAALVAMIVDVETTGLDVERDKAFEVGYVMVRFNRISGVIYEAESAYGGTEDPGAALSPEITKLTGVTDAELCGTRFDDARIEADVARSACVISHSAAFDRKFLERRFPVFCSAWFACTVQEIDWNSFGSSSKKLEFLAFSLAGVYYSAHRAVVDAQVVVELLTLRNADAGGATALKLLLDRSKQPTWRVAARDTPYETKGLLSGRGYRWADGSDPHRQYKAWWKEVVNLEAEIAFLREYIYSSPGVVEVERVSGRDRYASRALVGEQRRVGGEEPANLSGAAGVEMIDARAARPVARPEARAVPEVAAEFPI